MVIDNVKTVQALAVKLEVVLALGSANGWMFPLCNLDTWVGKAGELRRVWRHGSMMDRCLWLLWHAWLPFAWHSWELHKMDFMFSLSFFLFLFISVCASLPLQSCACHSACVGDNSWDSLFSLPVRSWNGTQVIRVCTNAHLHGKTQMSFSEKQDLSN